MPSSKKISVLHVALNPVTGPWSVMRDLAVAQAKSGLYGSVGLGIVHSKNWPSQYDQELKELGLPFFKAGTLQAFGTAQFLWQRLQKPPIGTWAQQLATQSGAAQVVVHFHNAWMSGVFLPLSPSPKCETRCGATVHGVNAQLPEKPIRHWLHRQMAARLPPHVSWLTSVDASNVPLAKSLLGLDTALFTVIANGVADDPESKCAVWNGNDELVVGHIGSISERKGWKLTADAVMQLRMEGMKIRLLIAGTGEDEAEAARMAQASGGAIEFLGHVSKPRKNLLPRLHVLSVMSRHEGLPMTIIESMAAGTPVVATDVGGIPEAVSDGDNGFLVARSTEALSQALRKLHASPEMWLAMSAAARQRYVEKFEISQIVAAYHSLYTANDE